LKTGGRSNETPLQNVVFNINGMLRKIKIDEQSLPLNEMLICSICLTTDRGHVLLLSTSVALAHFTHSISCLQLAILASESEK
jgi:hypothetical protein